MVAPRWKREEQQQQQQPPGVAPCATCRPVTSIAGGGFTGGQPSVSDLTYIKQEQLRLRAYCAARRGAARR